MARLMVIDLPDGTHPVLTETAAADEVQLQERLKEYPELLPLDELGLRGPAIVVGRESVLDSGRIDLVLLGNGGELALIEFKTGPQNPDFRGCLAQLIDYGSDLWGMSLDEFEERVAARYFSSKHRPPGAAGSSLDQVVESTWGSGADDAINWRERLQQQLRDGSFHYIAVAQRFTPPVLQTLRYLNATMTSRFSAVELVRFEGAGVSAFETRFVAGAEPAKKGGIAAKAALAGVDELLATVTDDEYRHALSDLFEALSSVPGLSVYWGTTGCSVRLALVDRSPLSIGWVFPPGPPRWLGLTDVTFGWYEDAKGLALGEAGKAGLQAFVSKLADLTGTSSPKAAAINGVTFPPDALAQHLHAVVDCVRELVTALVPA